TKSMKLFKYTFMFFYSLSYSQGLTINIVDYSLNEKDSLLSINLTIINESQTNQIISFTENICTKNTKKCYLYYGVCIFDTLEYIGLCSTSFWEGNNIEIHITDYDGSTNFTREVFEKKRVKKIKSNKKYTYRLIFCHVSNIPNVLKLPLQINDKEEIFYLN